MAPRLGGCFLALVIVGPLASGDAAALDAAPAVHRPARPDAAESARPASAERSTLGRAEGLVMLDYELIRLPGQGSIDLMGFHVLQRLNDWMFLGVGGYAPLVKGAYGGFMAFDATLHAQRRLWGDLFVDGGFSMGGGGGGKSKQQSVALSGTGGFVKAYLGLGYDFTGFAVGANVARMKFRQSAIDDTRLNVFVQLPFAYTVGPFAKSGDRLAAADAGGLFGESSETTLTWGLDNFVQIDPTGSSKGTIRVVDLQFAHYMTSRAYWYASLGVGYRGLPLYNQMVGGLGYRLELSPRIGLHAQLGVGSGGYAPEDVDTGSGLLVYPKLAAEYAIAPNLGLALSAGYLFAPKGTSKNYTWGASLNYRIQSGRRSAPPGPTSDPAVYAGYRFSLFPQAEVKVAYRGIDRARIDMLSGQLDTIVGDHVYVPVKGSIAYSAYLGYPGYGELLAGVGLQSRHTGDDRFQFFGQLLGGANVHGLLVQAGIGLNYSLSDRLAIYASAGKTRSTTSGDQKFKADYAGLGLTYRFSVPTR